MSSTQSTASIICLIILCGIPLLVYYVVVNPKNPTFTLEHASVTNFNLTLDNRLTSIFNVVIKANNTNHKLKLKYTRVRVSIYKNKQRIAKDALNKFTQRKRNVTLLQSKAVALNVRLKKSPAVDFRVESGVGYVDFDVYMTAMLNRNYYLKVNCNHAIVNITSPIVMGSSLGSNVEEDTFLKVGCRVRTHRIHR